MKQISKALKKKKKPSKRYFEIRKDKLLLLDCMCVCVCAYAFLATHIFFKNQVKGIHLLWSKTNSTFKCMKKAANVNAFQPSVISAVLWLQREGAVFQRKAPSHECHSTPGDVITDNGPVRSLHSLPFFCPELKSLHHSTAL